MDDDDAGNVEHPFAPWLRIVGRGPGRSRPLTRQEARDAFAAILERGAEDVQTGAFLLLLRYRGETPDELAGFVDAARAHHGWPALGTASAADLDWPSYATGPSRGAPWFLLSALLLARTGMRVLMHGVQPPGNPCSAEAVAARLGLPVVTSPSQAAGHLGNGGFAYLPLRFMAPALDRLMGLRPLLGLRTPVNSLVKLVNPAAAPAVIQGVFHPPYLDLHGRAAALLGQLRSSVFKGGRGEAERNPLKPCMLRVQHGGTWSDLEWPTLLGSGRGERPDPASPDHLVAVWRREAEDLVGEATVVGTAAIALATARPGMSPDEALRIAGDAWAAR